MDRSERADDGLAGQVVVDLGGQRAGALLDGSKGGDAQADNGSGQHDPVNGHSTVFVVVEFLRDFEQFHVSLSDKVSLVAPSAACPPGALAISRLRRGM